MPRRVLDVSGGVAMIVTDLHGDWDAYTRYRDRFFALRAQGEADRLVLCGDLIHGEGPADADRSLDVLLDVIDSQAMHGPGVIAMLLGNHELAHLYSIVLRKGNVEYTSRFEAMLSAAGNEVRARVFAFLDGLPFYLRTAAGVMVSHAGAAALAAKPDQAARLADFDHAALMARIEAGLDAGGRDRLRRAYIRLSGADYDAEARHYLAVTGPDDPRYDRLLWIFVLNERNPDFNLLWDTFFMRNEWDSGADAYRDVLAGFLRTWSERAPWPQRVLVAGHVPMQGSYHIVAERQLRLASAAHAQPREAGVYLLLDCAVPVQSPADLVPHLGSVFA